MTTQDSVVKTTGVVLSHVKYRETSAVVRILTRQMGLQSYIVNGVRGQKRKDLLPLLSPLTIIELESQYRPRATLQRLKESHVCRPFNSIPFDPSKRAIVMFITELLTKSLHENGPDEQLFDFVVASAVALDEGLAGLCNFHIFFMFRLTSLLGFAPDMSQPELPVFDLAEGAFSHSSFWTQNALSGHEKHLWLRLGAATLETLPELASSRTERQHFIDILLRYYQMHIPQFGQLQSHQILQQLFC